MNQSKVTVHNFHVSRKTPRGKFSIVVKDLSIPDSDNQQKIPIVGKSGAGKSTLLNALAGMIIPEKGNIKWTLSDKSFEFSNASWNEQTLIYLRRHYFGFSFQNSTLSKHFTVMENLVYPQLLAGKHPKKAKQNAEQKLIDFFENENIEKLKYRFPYKELSGGERQRVAIIQAIINDPVILFADEPTGNLDKDTQEHVMQLIFKWLEEKKNRLFIWVTHHENDPKMAGVEQYIEVSKYGDNMGTCKWIERKGIS